MAPTLENGVDGSFGFNPRVEPTDVGLIRLGLLLSLIGRVVRNEAEVAASLKQENDQIV